MTKGELLNLSQIIEDKKIKEIKIDLPSLK